MVPAENTQLLAEIFLMAQHAIAKTRLSRNIFSLKHNAWHACMLANKENHAFCHNFSYNPVLDVRVHEI